MPEVILIIASFGQYLRFRVLHNHPVEVQALITLKARYGMQMTIESR
jgi:hypothetical protein